MMIRIERITLSRSSLLLKSVIFEVVLREYCGPSQSWRLYMVHLFAIEATCFDVAKVQTICMALFVQSNLDGNLRTLQAHCSCKLLLSCVGHL